MDENAFTERIGNHDLPSSWTELLAQFARYEAEGHFTRAVCLTPDQPAGDAWMVWCTCGSSSGRRNVRDAKWWGRGHRIEHGLEWQQWQPKFTPDEFYAWAGYDGPR